MPKPRAHLPREIIAQCLEWLEQDTDRNHLLNLALISRVFRAEAQRILFQKMGDIYLFEQECCVLGDEQQASIRRHVLFLDAIISAPERLGAYVRSYTSIGDAVAPIETDVHSEEDLTRDDQGWYHHEFLTPKMHLWNKLHQAIPHMTGLKHLTLFTPTLRLNPDTRRHNTNAVALMKNCHACLETFVWGDSRGFAALQASNFFERQPRLRVFGFWRYEEDEYVPVSTDVRPTVLPRLEYIKGSTNTLLSVLPGQNVESVSWTLSFGEIPLDFVGRKLSRTRHLCMSGMKRMELILQYLVSVEVLCFRTHTFTWEADLSGIGALTSLRVLILQDRDERAERGWRARVDAIANFALAKCPTLLCVYVENYRQSHFHPVVRYENGTAWQEQEIWKEESKIHHALNVWMPWEFSRFKAPLSFL